MKFVSNAGQERVIDLLRENLHPGNQLDMVSPAYSLFAYAEILTDAGKLSRSRLIFPPETADIALLGSPVDRLARNKLQGPWLAKQFANWIDGKAEVRRAAGSRSAPMLGAPEKNPHWAGLGWSCPSLKFQTRAAC